MPPFGTNRELADAAKQFQPFLLYTRHTLPSVPLWNPYMMAGRPFLANGQSAVFSPFSVPAYVLPFWHSLAVIGFLKLWVAAFGTFLFASALGLRIGGALFSGVVFGLGQWTVDWLTWPQSSAWVLLPWLLWLTVLIIRRPSLLRFVALSLVVGAQFLGGHPEASYDVLAATAAFFAIMLFCQRRAGPLRLRIGSLAGAFAAGAMLASVAIIPFVELLLRSSDLRLRSQQHGGSIPTHYLAGLLLPDLWGRPTGTASPLLGTYMVDRAFYSGAITLLLAGVAVALKPSRARLGTLLLGAAVLVTVVGIEPFATIARLLPGPVRVDRLTFIFLLCVAVLAGWGVSDLTSSEPRRRRPILLALLAVLVLLPPIVMAIGGTLAPSQWRSAVTLASGLGRPSASLSPAQHTDVVRFAALLEWVVLAGAGLILIALRLRGRVGSRSFAALAVALVVIDLFKINLGYNPAIAHDRAVQPATAAIRYLQSRRPARFAALAPSFFGLEPMLPNIAMRWGLYDSRGYDYPVEDRYTRLWSRGIAPVSTEPQFIVPPSPSERALRTLRLLSTADLLQDPTAPRLRLPGLRLAYAGPDARVYSNPAALPRVFLVGGQRVVRSGAAALTAVLQPRFQPRREVITESRVPGLSGGSSAPLPGAVARLVTYRAQRLEVRASVPRPAMLVLTDTFYPGWKAAVDGREAPIQRVDYLLRGVSLTPGRHRIEFRYAPTSWRIGWITSTITLVILGCVSVVGMRRRRNRRKGGDEPGERLVASRGV